MCRSLDHLLCNFDGGMADCLLRHLSTFKLVDLADFYILLVFVLLTILIMVELSCNDLDRRSALYQSFHVMYFMSISAETQASTIEAFSRYFGNFLNIDNIYFEDIVDNIYPKEPQLNKANSSGTEASFLDLKFSVSNGINMSKIYYKRDDFDFVGCSFSRLWRLTFYVLWGINTSHPIRFARVFSSSPFLK